MPRNVIAGALVALAIFTAFDHGMRKMQLNGCRTDVDMQCPAKLWWFANEAITDSEVEALTGIPM